MLALFAILPAIVLYYGFNIKLRWLHRDLPGPKPAFLTGNMIELGALGKSHLTLQRWAKIYGDIFLFYLGRIPVITLTDADLIKEVAIKRFAVFHDRAQPLLVPGDKQVQKFANTGMLFSRGKDWSNLRAACEPLFHKTMLERYASLIDDASSKMVDLIAEESASSGQSISVQSAMSKMTIDVIGSTAFGVDFGAQKNRDKPSDVLEAAQIIFLPFDSVGKYIPLLSFVAPSLRKLFWWIYMYVVRSPGMRRMYDARSFLWSVLQVLLDNCRGEHKNEQQDTFDRKNQQFRRAYSLYQEVIAAEYSLINKLKDTIIRSSNKPLEDIDICSQAYTFLLAGYESSSLALTYTLYEVSKKPDLQKRLQQEVDGVLSAKKDGKLEFSDIASLQLCEATFSEALRMWPPGSSIVALAREARENTTIGGHTVIKGDRIMFNIYALHHDPKHFPEPEEFRPERFMAGSKEAEGRHPHAYIPFGLGPRKCIGYKLAMEEGILALAKVMQRFDLELDLEKHQGPLEVLAGITLVPKDGVWVQFYPRRTEEA